MPRALVTDETLMLAVRDGDVAKLGVLFERHHVALFDFLSRTIGDRTAAEDLVQDVFVRILKYRQTYRDQSCFETWMFRIARNSRTDHFRKRRSAEPIGDGAFEIEASGPSPAQQFERGREAKKLNRALMQLSDDKRELLVLARYRNMSYDKIAALLDVEVGAVKVRVHRAMKELREIFLRLVDEDKTWDVKKSGTDLRTI
jgi:RNA polymerase sigma factor (sigma-70 family)